MVKLVWFMWLEKLVKLAGRVGVVWWRLVRTKEIGWDSTWCDLMGLTRFNEVNESNEGS